MTRLASPDASAFEWCIAVFARNEQARLADCLKAVRTASRGVRSHIVVLINGSSDETYEVARTTVSALGASASIYTIKLACKSHAMNVFVHELRPAAQIYFFVDATAFVEPSALRALANGLAKMPDIMATSGLPVNGRGADRMRSDALRTSRLFGQMFALRASCLDRICELGRKLPIGLYRGDGLFVGFICWETDGVAHEHPMPRVATIPEAEWRISPISYLSWRDVKTGFNRRIRQARGRLENQAWNSIVWTQGFGALPRFADKMIRDWLQNHRPTQQPFADRIFTWLALRRIRRWQRPDEADLRPVIHAEI